MSKSKNRRKPVHVLLIDDDLGLAASLKNRARRYQIIMDTATNLEEGLDLLMNNQKYQAVILDGKAPLNAHQLKGTEAENFVHEAILRLREIELLHDRILPFCVHTAWYVQLEPSLRNRTLVFDKKKTAVDDSQMEAMFEYLHHEIAQLETTKIKLQYDDIFEFADRYLDEEDLSLLLNLLSPKTSTQRTFLLERLAFIRRLEESLLNIFCKECLKMDPMLFGLGKTSRGKELIDLVKTRKLAPLHVSFMTYVIYTTQSLAVQHKAPENSEFYNYPISIYTVQTFVNGLLDIILWIKDSIENGIKETGTTDMDL